MSGDTIECFNCGHANPSWAQICRSCGAPIRPDGPAGRGPQGIFPTDRASLISVGGAVGAIALAIVLGLFLSGVIPPIPAQTPSPTPSESASASRSAEPSASESVGPSASAVALIGTVAFGTGLNADTREVTGATTAFTAASAAFAHSITLSEPFAVIKIQEEVVRIADDGTETVVQARDDLDVSATALIAGYKSPLDVADLIAGWGTGSFILRVYRGGTLVAEGSFSLS